MEQLAVFALIGIATGSLYALVSLGIVLVYRASKVLNFAAGSTGASAAFLFYDLRDGQGLPWVLALLISLCVGGALGAVTQLVVMRLLRKASVLSKLIATLGMMTVFQGLIQVQFGSGTRGQPVGLLPTRPIRLTDTAVIGLDRLILIGLVVVLAIILRLVYTQTMFGLATSAVAENRTVASLGGLSANRIELSNFMLAGVLSALAAILLAPIVSLDPLTLTLVVLTPALAAALVGNFASFTLVVLAACAIGGAQSILQLKSVAIAEAFGVSPASLIGLPQAVPLLLIVVVTVLRGTARPVRGEMTARLPLPGSGLLSPVAMISGCVLGLALIWSLSSTWTAAISITLIYAVLILSIVVVTGYGGQLSLAQFALAGFGAWVSSRLFATTGLPFLWCLLFAVPATIVAGLVVALPALRTRGINLAIVTLAQALLFNALIFSNGSLTGGFNGTVVSEPSIFGLSVDPIDHPDRYGTLILVVLLVCGIVVSNIRRGRSGRRLLAVRSNERAASALGIGVLGAKLYAFAVGAGLAAVSGVLLAFSQPNVLFQQFNALGSIAAVQYAVVGGIGWPSGAAAGGALASGGIGAKVLHSIFGGGADVDSWLLVLGGLAVIAMIRQSPDGLAAFSARLFGKRLPKFPRPTAYVQNENTSEQLSRRTNEPPARDVIELRGIMARFGGVVALNDVSFTIKPGEVLGLMGPNGAGKTTLVDILTGFTSPTGGTVLRNGVVINGWSPEKRARAGIVRSWQAVELFDGMTVGENLLVADDAQRPGRYLTDLVRPGRQQPSALHADLVAEFGLAHLLDERPTALSQGTVRLIGIARAVCAGPSVLLLDEPAAGLDAEESRELGHAIRQIAERHGIAVVVVEHDVPMLMKICDRMVVLDFGVKIAEGDPLAVSSDPEVIRAYLGDENTTDRVVTAAPAALSGGDPR